MNLEQLAFLNHQLAGMLRSGIPLEAALRQLCRDMSHGPLREELLGLESDLSQGMPLDQALSRRKLPELYVQLVQLGAKGNDLPGVLTTAADYYSRLHALWTRLKGILVYPVLVLILALAVSLLVVFLTRYLVGELGDSGFALSPVLLFLPWFAPVFLLLLLLGGGLSLANRRLRSSLRWRLPAFREACLSQLAGSLALLLRGGCSFDEAIGLVQNLEPDQQVRAELAGWRKRLSEGHGRFAELAGAGRRVPGLFIWLVASAGEDLLAGLNRAAELYYSRSAYKVDMLLYAALPVSILILGVMLVGQVVPLARIWMQFMQWMSDPFLLMIW